LITCLLFFCFSIKGQDAQFTQFNAAPLYLNPAFSGTTLQHRFASSYRNQWTAISRGFINYTFSYDYNLSEINSGIGLLFKREQAGTGNLGTTEAGLLYAYHLKIDNKIFIHAGIKFSYASRGVDFSKLVFNDQLTTGNLNAPTSDDIAINNVNYLDITPGILLYSKKYWLGASFNHINTPNQSLINEESPLFLRLSTHGGYKINLSDGGGLRSLEKSEINIAFHYQAQQKFDQLDVGAYYGKKALSFGLWYRGLPLLKAQNNVLNNDALAIVVGYLVVGYNFRVGYSYDITVSRLAANSGGSHELSIIYEVANKKKKRRKKNFFVPCAKF